MAVHYCEEYSAILAIKKVVLDEGLVLHARTVGEVGLSDHVVLLAAVAVGLPELLGLPVAGLQH